MRSAVIYCAGAAICLGGCVSGREVAQREACREWASLCRVMPQHRQLRAVNHPVPALSSTQSAILRRAAAQALLSVVRIETTLPHHSVDSTPRTATVATSNASGGMGVVISRDGLILTNEHVLRGAEVVSVSMPSGEACVVETVAVDARLDLAVLRVGCQNLTPLALRVESVEEMLPVIAVARRALCDRDGLEPGVVTASLYSLQRELDPARRKDYSRLIQTSCRLEPGFSGGPLLDASGRFIGLNVAVTDIADAKNSRGYAIPFDREAVAAVERLVGEIRGASGSRGGL